MEFAEYPALHPQVASRIIDGAAVIIMADSGLVNVFNSVGTRVWELINGTRTIQEIADIVVAEYDVPAAAALEDVMSFLDQLRQVQAIALYDHPMPEEP